MTIHDWAELSAIGLTLLTAVGGIKYVSHLLIEFGGLLKSFEELKNGQRDMLERMAEFVTKDDLQDLRMLVFRGRNSET